ncbi:hypothetical protein CRYUN_Cryun28dG0023700 [Craigia yunnanensis]
MIKANRGNAASINRQEYLRWLDSKKPNSVLYICFGSLFRSSAAQINEIAKDLEASGQDFIWVLKKEEKPFWLLEEFEERVKGKGLIIRGWAPQVLILDHEAVGGVDVGAKERSRWVDDTKFSVTKEDIGRAVTRLLVGKEAEEIKRRARAMKDMARKAVEEGGSYYSDLNALLEELRLNCP